MEKVQKRATKLIVSLKDKSYEERLRILYLPTLKFRRIRGDMIETYKIITGKYDALITPQFPISSESVTRGNSLKIINRRCHYDIRKYSFCNRVVNIWNSLPNEIVTAPSLNLFKTDLTNIGKIKMLDIIGMLKFLEPEVEVILLSRDVNFGFFRKSIIVLKKSIFFRLSNLGLAHR